MLRRCTVLPKKAVRKHVKTKAFQYLKEACKKDGDKLFSRAWCDRMRGNGFKLEEIRFRLDIRKKFLWWGWWNTGTGCPERWLMPHPWKCSRPGWSRLWATWSSWRCPCSLQGGWAKRPLKVPSTPNRSVISSFSSFDPACLLHLIRSGTSVTQIKAFWLV